MNLLTKNINKKINMLEEDIICDAHKGATTLDDRSRDCSEYWVKE